MTIDVLPDLALLKIFDFYVREKRKAYANVHVEHIEAWRTLVHVCRNWRIVVFGSPHRLGLRLCCSNSTPVKEMLDVWPLLPIVIVSHDKKWGVDNIIAALEHNDRICELYLFGSQMEKIFAAMQRSFPALTRLRLYKIALVVSPSFLGASAPRLRSLRSGNISFPGLPKLLLSATHLIRLDLRSIPHSGYISPEAMVTALSVLIRLERLDIEFESPQSHPDEKSRPPPTRTLLPVLTTLAIKGVSKYLEDFVARIDAPLLDNLIITFFNQLRFDTPQLTQFIGRTPKLNAHDQADVVFSEDEVWVTLPQPFDGNLQLRILCRPLDLRISSLAQICSLSFPQSLISAVEHLHIRILYLRSCWQDDIGNSQWLELLHPFTAVKSLYIDDYFSPRIVPALQELVGERVTEVLPNLQNLFLNETRIKTCPGSIRQFVAARQLAGHSIAVSRPG